MRKKFKINYVKWGIANRYPGRRIEVNQRLLSPEYKDLLIEIVEHEMKHTDSGYSKMDFLLDMNGFQNRRLYWKFILTTPSSWFQLSPIVKSDDKYYIDFSVIWFWYFTFIVIGLVTWWIFRII